MRAALALVLVMAIAGCGSDQDPTLSGPVPSSSPSSTTGATAAPPDASACTGGDAATEGDIRALTLGIGHGELRAGAAVTWTLTVTNGGDEEVELVFPSSQDGDVVISQDQTEVYRWSDGMAFTQAVRCQVLPAGATATYELAQPVLDLAPGQYQLRASLSSDPKPSDVVTQITVEG